MLVSFSYFLFRKRRIESEYGPILDSNNPHSLNKDSIDQGTLLFGMRLCLILENNQVQYSVRYSYKPVLAKI